MIFSHIIISIKNRLNQLLLRFQLEYSSNCINTKVLELILYASFVAKLMQFCDATERDKNKQKLSISLFKVGWETAGIIIYFLKQSKRKLCKKKMNKIICRITDHIRSALLLKSTLFEPPIRNQIILSSWKRWPLIGRLQVTQTRDYYIGKGKTTSLRIYVTRSVA